MKGAIFIALEEYIIDQHGLKTWHTLLDEANTQGIFTATANYQDEDMVALLTATCTLLDTSLPAVLRSFGEYLFAFLHKGHPLFADSQPGFYEFIKSIDGVIHIEVHKLDDDARPPSINVNALEDGTIQALYHSQRKLCYLAEGLLSGAATHFGNRISITQESCMHDGHDHCDLRITVHE